MERSGYFARRGVVWLQSGAEAAPVDGGRQAGLLITGISAVDSLALEIFVAGRIHSEVSLVGKVIPPTLSRSAHAAC